MADRIATVACVLKSGGVYSRRWVRALLSGVREHWPPGPYLDFVCLTDTGLDMAGVTTYPLVCNLPGWWSKLELFRPDVFDRPVLYMDLDTLPVGGLAPLLDYGGEFAMISDLWQLDRAQSGLMAWRPGAMSAAVWDIFMDDPRGRMREYHGDGEFIRTVLDPVDRLQDVAPGAIADFKLRQPRRIIDAPPKGAAVVCGHGDPRFNSRAAGWAHDVWAERATVRYGRAA